MAKEKTAATVEPEAQPVVESVKEVADELVRSDQELEAKFGKRQSIAGEAIERITEKALSRPEPERPAEDDLKLDHCEWVKFHFNRIAAKDLGAHVYRDEWNPEIIQVEIRGRPGSISVAFIEELRRTRNLGSITKGMQSYLSGYLPEYRLTDDQLYGI